MYQVWQFYFTSMFQTSARNRRSFRGERSVRYTWHIGRQTCFIIIVHTPGIMYECLVKIKKNKKRRGFHWKKTDSPRGLSFFSEVGNGCVVGGVESLPGTSYYSGVSLLCSTRRIKPTLCFCRASEVPFLVTVVYQHFYSSGEVIFSGQIFLIMLNASYRKCPPQAYIEALYF